MCIGNEIDWGTSVRLVMLFGVLVCVKTNKTNSLVVDENADRNFGSFGGRHNGGQIKVAIQTKAILGKLLVRPNGTK